VTARSVSLLKSYQAYAALRQKFPGLIELDEGGYQRDKMEPQMAAAEV
jgi:hypothetical protein